MTPAIKDLKYTEPFSSAVTSKVRQHHMQEFTCLVAGVIMFSKVPGVAWINQKQKRRVLKNDCWILWPGRLLIAIGEMATVWWHAEM